MNLALYPSTQYAARSDLPKHLHDLARHDHVVFYPGTNTITLQGPKGPEKVTVHGRASGNDFFFVRDCVRVFRGRVWLSRSPGGATSSLELGALLSMRSRPAARLESLGLSRGTLCRCWSELNIPESDIDHWQRLAEAVISDQDGPGMITA